MKLRHRCMQTLGVSVNQLRRKLLELGGRFLHVPSSKTTRDMALVMLSVSSTMDVGSGGGHGGLNGRGLEGALANRNAKDMQDAEAAAARDRAVRTGSVRQDLALDLPPRLQLPDGEERPYGAHQGMHLRDPEQESEIYQKCVRPPPNRTIFDSESPPPYRSHQSVLLEPSERIVRCHSAGSSLLKVFRKSGTTSTALSAESSGTSASMAAMATTAPAPRRLTLSSYSESSSNLSNLSSLTVVPCETNQDQQRYA